MYFLNFLFIEHFFFLLSFFLYCSDLICLKVMFMFFSNQAEFTPEDLDSRKRLLNLEVRRATCLVHHFLSSV